MTDDELRDRVRAFQSAPDGDAGRPILEAVRRALSEPAAAEGPDPLSAVMATADPADPDLAGTLRAALTTPPEPWGDDDLVTDDGPDPAPRRWLFGGWLPRGRLAALYGRGEAGKSRLALHLAHAVALGGPMVPWDPDVRADAVRGDVPVADDRGGGRVLLVTWEDEADEVRRRWRMAHRAGAVDCERMPAEIAILDMRRVGAGALWGPHGKGSGHVSTRGEWTEAGRRLLATLPAFDLAVIDPLASAYACSENDRALVRAFSAALDAAAEDGDCAVLLAGHPSRTGEDDPGAESGSTDWRNAVRSRLVLAPMDTAHAVKGGGRNGKDAPVKAPALRQDKASYAAGGAHVWLRSHYEAGNGGRLAWFATTAGAAARAINPAAKGGGSDDGEAQDDPDAIQR